MKHLGIISTQVQPWGGSEELWAEVALAARGDGIAVTACVTENCRDHPRIGELASAGVKFRFRPEGPARPPSLQRRAARFVARQLGGRLDSPDPGAFWNDAFSELPERLLISQGGAYCGLWLAGLPEWLARTNVPRAVVCQSGRSQRAVDESLREQARRYLEGFALIGFVAAANQAEVRLQLAHDLPRSRVVQNPLRFAPAAAIPWPAAESPTLACVARLEVEDKGQDLLLQLLSEPPWTERQLRVTGFGSGRDEAHLRRLTAMFKLNERIRWAGQSDGVAGVWATHQLLVLPSRSEGTPLSLQEAMLAGRPAVATDVGGIAEWLVDGATGFLAESPSVKHLSKAMERAWAARARWQEMGQAARIHALKLRDPAPGLTLLRWLSRMPEVPASTGT